MSIIGLLQAAAVLTIVFSLLTGFGIPHRNIELFSHFRLQYFVVSILLVVIFAIKRDYTYAGALAVTVIFNATFILPWYFGEPDISDGTPLKLIHANVHSHSTRYSRLIDFIKVEKPDIFILQEVTPKWVAGTQELLKDYPYAYTESRNGSFGIAAFSRIPFDSIRHIDSPPLAYPTILATVSINEEPLTLISSHPTIPVSRHLYTARNEQLGSVAELVNQASGRVILLGDLNSSTWCAHFRRLVDSTGLKNVRKGIGILPSWPTFLPFAMIPIDHVLVSNSISVTDVRTGNNIGSDHLPLIVTLSM